MSRSYEPDRRHLLLAGAAGAAGISLPSFATGQELTPTPECRDEHDATPRQTEGPFFKPKSPQRADLREGDVGSELGEIAKANPEVTIGSYPFFDDKLGPNTNIVVRGRDQVKLSAAKKAVEEMLRRVREAMREQA